jgi:hypothetical protein
VTNPQYRQVHYIGGPLNGTSENLPWDIEVVTADEVPIIDPRPPETATTANLRVRFVRIQYMPAPEDDNVWTPGGLSVAEVRKREGK